MKKILKNNLGMTLVEVLLAVMIFVLMIWTFAPFVAATFKQIAQAGNLHISLSEEVSEIDSFIADEFFGLPGTFPVKVGSNDNIDVNGIHLSTDIHKLHTFYSAVTSYISTDDILYEGYGSDGFYNSFYSIGFLPEITDKKFFKNDHTYVVNLWDSQTPPHYYVVAEEFTVLHSDPKNDINMTDVAEDENIFIVASQFPDGVGGNPDKIGYILLVPDRLGLDNQNSPYFLDIETKDTGQHFTEESIRIDVMLPLYQAVGEDGHERIASNINYWVDKYTDYDPNVGVGGIDTTRLERGITYNDVLWYMDPDSTELNPGRYYTVGDDGHIWYREHQVPWTKVMDGSITADLNMIKRFGDTFIVVGDAGSIWTSPVTDGINWTDKSISGASGVDFISIATNFSGYVIIAEDGTTYKTDLTFSSISSYGTASSGILDYDGDGTADITAPIIVNDMVWTGSNYVAVGNGNLIAVSVPEVSNNGVVWRLLEPDSTVKPPGGLNDLNCVFVHLSTGYISGDNGQIYAFGITASVDSWDWTTIRSFNDGDNKSDLYDMTFSRRALVVVGEAGTVMYSLNGVTWVDCVTMEGFDDTTIIYAVAGRE